MFDVTTVLVSTEFGRTLRQDGVAINSCGTDHNPYAGSCLLFGGNTIGGQVLGATDLDNLDDQGQLAGVSPLHRQLDSQLLKAIGKPIEKSSGIPIDVFPETYDKAQFLHVDSVVNAILQDFGVARETWRKSGRDAVLDPLAGLFRGR